MILSLPKYILLEIVKYDIPERSRLNFMLTCKKTYLLRPLYVRYVKSTYNIYSIYSQGKFLAITEFLPNYAHLVCMTKEIWLINTVIDKIPIRKDMSSLFEIMAEYAPPEAVHYFLKKIPEDKKTLDFWEHGFIGACAGGNFEIINFIRPAYDYMVMKGIICASEKGRLDVVKMLLKEPYSSVKLFEGYPLNYFPRYAIYAAMFSGNKELLEYCCKITNQKVLPEDIIYQNIFQSIADKNVEECRKLVASLGKDITDPHRIVNLQITCAFCRNFKTGNLKMIMDFEKALQHLLNHTHYPKLCVKAAIKSGNLEIIKWARERYSPTMLEYGGGTREVIKYLMEVTTEKSRKDYDKIMKMSLKFLEE